MAFPTGWGQYHKITIDASKVAGNLTNYPIPLADGNFLATVYANTQSAGQDIRFSLDTGGASQLPFEIVHWSTASQISEVHVKVDSLVTTANKEFFVWYDNSGAAALDATDTYGSQNVWDDNFMAVWHFGSASDSTKYGYDLTGVGFAGSAPTYSNAQSRISTGVSAGLVNSTHKSAWVIPESSAPSITSDNPKTWQGWFYPTEADPVDYYRVLSKDASGNRGTGYGTNGPNRDFTGNSFYDGTNNYQVNSEPGDNVDAQAWNFAALITNEDTYLSAYYRNVGYVGNPSVAAPNLPYQNSGCTIEIGALASFNLWADSYYDEIRASNIVRDLAWLQTDYVAQATTSLFSTGSEPAANGAAPITPTIDPLSGCLTMFTKLWN